MLKTKEITSSLITLTIKVMTTTLISRGGRYVWYIISGLARRNVMPSIQLP